MPVSITRYRSKSADRVLLVPCSREKEKVPPNCSRCREIRLSNQVIAETSLLRVRPVARVGYGYFRSPLNFCLKVCMK
jgi:hypothetical protein